MSSDSCIGRSCFHIGSSRMNACSVVQPACPQNVRSHAAERQIPSLDSQRCTSSSSRKHNMKNRILLVSLVALGLAACGEKETRSAIDTAGQKASEAVE